MYRLFGTVGGDPLHHRLCELTGRERRLNRHPFYAVDASCRDLGRWFWKIDSSSSYFSDGDRNSKKKNPIKATHQLRTLSETLQSEVFVSDLVLSRLKTSEFQNRIRIRKPAKMNRCCTASKCDNCQTCEKVEPFQKCQIFRSDGGRRGQAEGEGGPRNRS